MAETKLSLGVKAEKDFMYFFDETGKYNSQNNKTGWGLPNNRIADVTIAVIRVFLPKSETYIAVNVFPSLPNTDNVGFEIIPSDIGLDSFPPGVYKFQYVITMTDSTVLIRTIYFFYYQPLECCINKKVSKLNLTDVDSVSAEKAYELQLLLENAIWALCSGQLEKSQEISDYIWSQCGCCC